MQQEIINLLRNLQRKKTTSEEYQTFQSNIQSEDFVNAMCSIVLNQEFPLHDRIINIYALKAFRSLIPKQCLEQLFPLIFDESVQQFIVQLFIASYDKQSIKEMIFPILFENFANNSTDYAFLKGAVYFFSEYIEMYKIRNVNILNILFEILLQSSHYKDELMILVFDTIIKQMLIIPRKNSKIRNHDLYMIFQFLKNIDVDNTSIIIIDHILSFINERIWYCDELFDDEVYDKLFEILDMIVEQCPLSPDQFEITTPLYYLIRLLKSKDCLIPLEKLFPILVMSDEQINSMENDVNHFFKAHFSFGDTINDDDDDDDDEMDDEQDTSFSDEEEEEEDSDECDEIECTNSYLERNAWKCLYKSESLNYLQELIRIQIATYPDEYIYKAIEMCFENINQNPNINLPILLLFKCISPMINFTFNPFEFEMYDSNIIQYLLIDYCNDRIIEKGIEESELFFSFIKQIDFNNIAASILSNDEPVNILCLFGIIINGPRDYIDPSIYASVLFKVLTVVLPRLNFNEDKIELLENVFNYLSPGEKISQCTENYVLSLDTKTREKKSKSIFCLDEEYALAFKDEEETFFGRDFISVVLEMMDFPDIIFQIAKIIKYFAAGNIRKYVKRHNGATQSEEQEETIVDLSNYSVYFPDIIHMFQVILDESLWDGKTVDSYFILFSKTFINIFAPEDETVMNIINASYDEFIQLDLSDLLNLSRIESVLRIFIKYGKLEGLDTIILSICESECQHVKNLVYEISFVLMNQYQIYSDEVILNISNLLRNIIRQDPRNYIQSIICIFARVALYNVEQFEKILIGENIEELIIHLINILSINSFKYFDELEQRMIIAFLGLYSSNQQIAKATEDLIIAMIQNLDTIFSEPKNDIGVFDITSSLSVIKESIFYDDIEFLSHPFISTSLSNLIHNIQADSLVGNFFEKYPIL